MLYSIHCFHRLFIVNSFYYSQITRLQQAVQYIKQNIKDTELLTDLEVSLGKCCNFNHYTFELNPSLLYKIFYNAAESDCISVSKIDGKYH